jgi:hypothetical protein
MPGALRRPSELLRRLFFLYIDEARQRQSNRGRPAHIQPIGAFVNAHEQRLWKCQAN